MKLFKRWAEGGEVYNEIRDEDLDEEESEDDDECGDDDNTTW